MLTGANARDAAPQSDDLQGIFVAPWGSDSDLGTFDAPKATFQGAAKAVADLKRSEGLPEGGVTVYFRGGTYYFDQTVFLRAGDGGTPDSRVTYRSYPGEEAIFDGSLRIPTDGLKAVAAGPQMHPSVQDGEVWAASISDPKLVEILGKWDAHLSYNGKAINLARWPNKGYAHIDRVLDEGAIYYKGRSPGEAPDYSLASPVGGLFTVREQWSGDWRQELGRVRKAKFHGYEHHDWWMNHFTIASISENDAIKLMEFSNYGVKDAYAKTARRFYVSNLLSELDQPGEWYFDEREKLFYIYPLKERGALSSASLGVWSAPPFVQIEASYVTLQDLTIESTLRSPISGGGMVTISGGKGNLIAGCTLRNSLRPAVSILGGSDNGVRSCDIYDVQCFLILDGGDIPTLTAAGNYAINNQFTTLHNDIAANAVIHINGVGQVFKNNLIHNFERGWLQMHGNLHEFAFNELFYTGFGMGDGGCLSPGSSSMMSYGSVIRNNFFHHIYSWPGAHSRGGVYPDQYAAGQNIEGNVFYKAGHRSVLLNGGAGNRVVGNYFIEGNIGVYQTSTWAKVAYEAYLIYNGGSKTGPAGNFVGRVEDVIGVEGWNQEPWRTTFPKMARILNQEKERFWPIETVLEDNVFCDMNTNLSFRWGSSKDAATEDMHHPQAAPYVTESGSREVDKSVFVNPKTMNFKPVRDDLPPVPFDQIGLFIDEHRTEVPSKDHYRSEVRKHWENRPAWEDKLTYKPGEIEWLYFNTGELTDPAPLNESNP